jgi:hypothetical protein
VVLIIISHIILDGLFKAQDKFPDNELGVCVLIGFLSGCSAHFIVLINDQRIPTPDFIRVYITSLITVVLYVLFLRYHLLALPISQFLSKIPFSFSYKDRITSILSFYINPPEKSLIEIKKIVPLFSGTSAFLISEIYTLV